MAEIGQNFDDIIVMDEKEVNEVEIDFFVNLQNDKILNEERNVGGGNIEDLLTEIMTADQTAFCEEFTRSYQGFSREDIRLLLLVTFQIIQKQRLSDSNEKSSDEDFPRF